MSAIATLAGLWKRKGEEDPIGTVVDKDTLVHWIQAPSGMYVDVRIPKDSPGYDISAASCAKRPAALAGKMEAAVWQEHSKILVKQSSFAGILQVSLGDSTDGSALRQDKKLQALHQSKPLLPLCVCHWHRQVDYRPPTGNPDVGVCVSAAAPDNGWLWLRETGQDASYAEDWWRPTDSANGPFVALELMENDHRKGYWVRAGKYFAYAVGRLHELGVAKSLTEALDGIISEEERCEIVSSYVGVAGEVNEKGNWVIHHSLNPELVGCSLFGDTELSCSQITKDGDVIKQILCDKRSRNWKVVELTPGALPVAGK